ncbi:MAG: Na+-transporting NADH:ubiquinone oxidoreductase subunit C [Candidatus Azotimanducaceae bacterium]|jgi:Na+-transporting NADH:ubiquinone oxidoreductase subunit C
MDVNKNSYTFIFATVMVVVVAALLSTAAIFLKEPQAENMRREKMQNILYTVGVRDAADATEPISRKLASVKYAEYVKQEIVLVDGVVTEKDAEGNKIEAFKVDMAKEMKKDDDKRKFPLYVANNNGETFYIIPVRGKGLWGPIWGYIALGEDMNEVVGASFDHKGETPGLGAEIVTTTFSDQFIGKKILDANGTFVSIQVMKGNAAGDYQVDGISGGTITSVGVEDMLQDCISNYMTYFMAIQNSMEEEAAPAMDSTAVITELYSNNIQ